MLVKLQCPQCGAAMEIDDQQDQIYCSHCGTRIANIRERVEITQNVNVSGTVRHVMDRSNEPNLYISYATANPSVVMVVRIVDTGTKNTYLNGQTQTYHLRQGCHEIVLKIGKKNYNRTIIIPQDNSPVRINAAFTGRRAEITIDQPNMTAANSAAGDQNLLVKSQAPKRKQSVLGIVAFILSFLLYTSPIAVGLAIFDLVRSKKDEEHSHGLAIAALIIGSLFSLVLIMSLVSPKTDTSGSTTLQSYQDTTVSETKTSVQNKSTDEQVKEQTAPTSKPTKKPTQKPTEDTTPKEYKTALAAAQTYVNLMHMSKAQLYDQLTSEYGEAFSKDAAQYAIEHVNANWKENALKSAETYSNMMHMSKAGIYNQLISEYGDRFTKEEAQYAIDNIKADWKANALESAKSYRKLMNMSKAAIYDQLISEYGDQFTREEAQYAIDHIDD